MAQIVKLNEYSLMWEFRMPDLSQMLSERDKLKQAAGIVRDRRARSLIRCRLKALSESIEAAHLRRRHLADSATLAGPNTRSA